MLLLSAELPHLILLLLLHLLPLLGHALDGEAITLLNLLGHPILLHLSIENALVRVLHLSLVQSLLLNLLLTLDTSHLFSLSILLLDKLLLLLLLLRKVVHVFLVDMILFVESCTLYCLETLLIGLPWVILKFRHRGQVAAGMALGDLLRHGSCWTCSHIDLISHLSHDSWAGYHAWSRLILLQTVAEMLHAADSVYDIVVS